MLKKLIAIVTAVSLMFTAGCFHITTPEPEVQVTTNVIHRVVYTANDANVYQFAEQTDVPVLIQNPKTGKWEPLEGLLRVPKGYYIGSGK